jgi:hypothetical protein
MRSPSATVFSDDENRALRESTPTGRPESGSGLLLDRRLTAPHSPELEPDIVLNEPQPQHRNASGVDDTLHTKWQLFLQVTDSAEVERLRALKQIYAEVCDRSIDSSDIRMNVHSDSEGAFITALFRTMLKREPSKPD